MEKTKELLLNEVNLVWKHFITKAWDCSDNYEKAV